MWKNIEIAVYLMFIGMGIVFLALFLLAGFINSIGWMERWVGRLRVKPNAAVEGGLAGELSPEEVAVIAAAVTTALQKKVRIHRIHLLHDESQEAWSREGRMDIMRSHNLQVPK